MKKELTDYLDKEISIFQYYFTHYFDTNSKNIHIDDAYLLGSLGANFQYYVRCLKDNTPDSIRKNCDEDKQYIVNYEISLEKFPGLIDFIIDEYEEDLEILKESDPIKYYQLTTFLK